MRVWTCTWRSEDDSERSAAVVVARSRPVAISRLRAKLGTPDHQRLKALEVLPLEENAAHVVVLVG